MYAPHYLFVADHDLRLTANERQSPRINAKTSPIVNAIRDICGDWRSYAVFSQLIAIRGFENFFCNGSVSLADKEIEIAVANSAPGPQNRVMKVPAFSEMLRALIAAPSVSSVNPGWDMSNAPVIELLHGWAGRF